MSKMAAAFNLWMDEYVNDPEAFVSTTKLALDHLNEKLDGKPASYGETTEATLLAYIDRIENEELYSHND